MVHIGVDVAHCRISSEQSLSDVKIELLSYTEVAVDPAIRSQVLRLCRPNQAGAATSMAEVCDLNFALGREFSRAIEQSGIDLAHVDIIASHGQTLWHEPATEHRSTLQMAEPAVIAQRTKRYYATSRDIARHSCFSDRAPEPSSRASGWPKWLQAVRGHRSLASSKPVFSPSRE